MKLKKKEEGKKQCLISWVCGFCFDYTISFTVNDQQQMKVSYAFKCKLANAQECLPKAERYTRAQDVTPRAHK